MVASPRRPPVNVQAAGTSSASGTRHGLIDHTEPMLSQERPPLSSRHQPRVALRIIGTQRHPAMVRAPAIRACGSAALHTQTRSSASLAPQTKILPAIRGLSLVPPDGLKR